MFVLFLKQTKNLQSALSRKDTTRLIERTSFVEFVYFGNLHPLVMAPSPYGQILCTRENFNLDPCLARDWIIEWLSCYRHIGYEVRTKIVIVAPMSWLLLSAMSSVSWEVCKIPPTFMPGRTRFDKCSHTLRPIEERSIFYARHNNLRYSTKLASRFRLLKQ